MSTPATPLVLPAAVADNGSNGGVGTTTPTKTPATAGAVTAAAVAGAPALLPGGARSTRTTTATAITGTWHTSVTIDALWYADEVRNAWMHVAGLGWKKIFNGSDGAFTALASLAAQARQTGHSISYREEADGMAHEIYLW